MASRAFINVITSFAIIEGALMMLDEANKERPEDSIHDKIADVRKHLDTAHKLWPGELTVGRLKRISNRLTDWENMMFPDRTIDIVTMSSLGLAMIDEIMTYVTNKRKTKCLLNIQDALLRVHKHFDPDFEQTELFELADRAFNTWKQIQKEA